MITSLSEVKRNKLLQSVWYHGDCLDLLRVIPEASVQLVITSPPYSLGKDYERGVSLAEALRFQERVIEECHRIVKPTGSICWQIGTYVDDGEVVPLDILTYKLFRHLGMKLRNRIIWQFGHGLHATHRFSGRYETILWFTKTDNYFFDIDPVRVPQKQPNKKAFKGPRKGQISSNPLGKNPGDCWYISNVKAGHPEKIEDGHPCQFPTEIVKRLILSMSSPGDVVLDPFGGVASTMVAALDLGRIAISSEIDEKYYSLGYKRLKGAKPRSQRHEPSETLNTRGIRHSSKDLVP